MASSKTMLETLITSWLNPRLGFPEGTPLWNKREDGSNQATIGMCYLYRCLGVWAVHKMVTDGGGVTVILSDSTGTGLEKQLRAYLRGMDSTKE